MRGILRGILMAQLVTNKMVDRYVFVRIAGGQAMGAWTSGGRALGRWLCCMMAKPIEKSPGCEPRPGTAWSTFPCA
jgi:hypothetical protein